MELIVTSDGSERTLAAAAPAASAGSGVSGAKAPAPLFEGPSVTVTWANGETLLDRLAALHGGETADGAAAVLAMMDTVYRTLLETAKNLGPSEREIELRRRRKAELEKQMRLLEAKAVTVEQALVRFENTMLSAADRRLLEANMARERPAMA